MENLLIIGNRSFFIEKNEKVYNGTERMLEVLISVLKDNYNIHLMCHNVNDKLLNMYKESYPFCHSISKLLIKDDLKSYIESNNISKILMSGWMSDELVSCINDTLISCDLPIAIMVHGTNCSGDARDFTKSMSSNPNIKLITMTDHEEKLYIDNEFPKERIIRINNPVDLGSVTPYYLDNNPPELKEDCIVIARMQVEKGIPNSAELCKRMNKKLAIRGKKYRGHVVRYLAEHYSDNHYLIEPLCRDKLLELEKSYQLFILLNNIPEGQNLSVIEANSLGVPVVCWKDKEYAYSNFLDKDYNIFLDKNADYAEQFMNEYYPKLDFYLDPSNRRELSKRTYEKYGIETYKTNLIKIMEDL